VLEKQGVVNRDHACFSSWLDNHNEKAMFTATQVQSWSRRHLQMCHWYIEMSPDATPPHEESNRKMMEPTFIAPEPIIPPPAPSGRKTRSKVKASVTLANSNKIEASLHTNKRTAPVVSVEVSKRNKLDDDEPPTTELQEVTQSVSETKSGPGQHSGTRSLGGNNWGYRSELVTRDLKGKEFQHVVFNASVAEFLKHGQSGRPVCSVRS
jgi:hypothetical protein